MFRWFSCNLFKFCVMLVCLPIFLVVYQYREHFLKKCFTQKETFWRKVEVDPFGKSYESSFAVSSIYNFLKFS